MKLACIRSNRRKSKRFLPNPQRSALPPPTPLRLQAAQRGPGSALVLAKLLERNAGPPEALKKYVSRTINDDDNMQPEPNEDEMPPIDPRDQVSGGAHSEERCVPLTLDSILLSQSAGNMDAGHR